MNEQPETQPEPIETPVNQPAPAAPATEPVSPTPPEWPGAFGVYKYSKAAVKVNLWALVIIWVVNGLLGSGLSDKGHAGGGLASFLLGALAVSALNLLYLAGIRRQKMSLESALSKGVKFWLQMLLLEILVVLALTLSVLALVIPFLFVLPRLMLSGYFLVDKNLSAVDAFKASWHTTKGHSLKVWGIIGANFLMALLMITIIGIPFSIYFLVMYSAAFAVLYEMIKDTAPAPATESAQPMPTPEEPAGQNPPAAPPAAV